MGSPWSPSPFNHNRHSYRMAFNYCLAFDNCLDFTASRTYQHLGTVVRNFRVYILQPHYHNSVVQHLREWMF